MDLKEYVKSIIRHSPLALPVLLFPFPWVNEKKARKAREKARDETTHGHGEKGGKLDRMREQKFEVMRQWINAPS